MGDGAAPHVLAHALAPPRLHHKLACQRNGRLDLEGTQHLQPQECNAWVLQLMSMKVMIQSNNMVMIIIIPLLLMIIIIIIVQI